VCACVSVRLSAADRDALAGTIVAAGDLRRYVQTMLERSETFRQQWNRIEAARVYVRIRRDVQLQNRPYRARTIIHRLLDGAIVASIEVDACGDPTEWLAHEFEHILEQMDGVDVAFVARTRREDAWASSADTFETERAIRVGQAVRREVKRAVR
jgi:hypothetical protein